MDSLLASYASSDEEDQGGPEQPENIVHTAKPPKISPLSSSLRPPKSLRSLSSSLPPPKSNLPDPPQTQINLASSKPNYQIQQQEQNKSSSVFSSLPPPKSRNTDPLALSNLSTSSSNPNRKRVVQVNLPINPSLIKSRNFADDDDDDDEKEREGKKSAESSLQTSSVKSFLSSIPAPKNSSALGALPTASGSGRRSIIESEVTTSNSNSFEAESEVSANPLEQNYDGQWADGTSSASLGDVGASAEYAVGGGSGGGDSSAWFENYDNSAGYGNYGYYGQHESNWDGATTAMTPSDTLGTFESVVKVPGKRGRNEVPREIVEVNQDELIKNRPREDQARLTGIAFGPSYQPVSTKGKPSKLHKRKHQIGSLFFDMKQKEMELAERRAKGFLTKAETQAKYGW